LAKECIVKRFKGNMISNSCNINNLRSGSFGWKVTGTKLEVARFLFLKVLFFSDGK